MVTISQNKVTFQPTQEFLDTKGGIQLLFLRPALRKARAVQLYNAMIEAFSARVSHWKLFSFYQTNPERILLKSFHEIESRISGPKNALFGTQRFFVVAYEPEDGVAEFIHAVAPSALLIVIAEPRYADSRPETMSRADMAIVVSETGSVAPDSNCFSVPDFPSIPPLMRSWIDGWIFGRNPSLVPMFGTDDGLSDLRARIEKDGSNGTAPLILLMGPHKRFEGSRVAAGIRNALCAEARAAYISLALRHKYWGLLQNPHMDDAQKLSWLLRAGIAPCFIQEGAAA